MTTDFCWVSCFCEYAVEIKSKLAAININFFIALIRHQITAFVPALFGLMLNFFQFTNEFRRRKT